MCLGSTINYLIDNTADALSQMSRASRAIDALKFIWNAREAPLSTKVKLHNVILLNLLLRGSKNLSSNRNDLPKYEAFHHKAIRRTLGMSMLKVKDKKLETRKCTNNL